MEINILLLIVLAFMVFKIWDGYNKGMVKEIISFISLIFLCFVVVLIGGWVSIYHDGKILNVIVAVVLMSLLSIVQHLINVAAFPAKLVTKLPVVHSVDKILGVAVGVLETLLILWTVYTFVMMMDLGVIGDFILRCAADNTVLRWLYEHNQLAGWATKLLSELVRFYIFL